MQLPWKPPTLSTAWKRTRSIHITVWACHVTVAARLRSKTGATSRTIKLDQPLKWQSPKDCYLLNLCGRCRIGIEKTPKKAYRSRASYGGEQTTEKSAGLHQFKMIFRAILMEMFHVSAPRQSDFHTGREAGLCEKVDLLRLGNTLCNLWAGNNWSKVLQS